MNGRVRPGVALIATVSRRDDLIWADVSNTLMPGQNITGAVFFERDKKARDVVLRIPLSGVTFDVPLTIR